MIRTIEVKTAESSGHFIVAREIILEYVQWLGIDLSFQNFDREINNLQAMYSRPAGGLLIAMADGEPAGVAGIRKYQDDACELKRMFVRSPYRNLGIGRKLLEASVDLARQLGYKIIKLDTADFMKDAVKLYLSYGFVEIQAYRHNPMAEARYFELKIG